MAKTSTFQRRFLEVIERTGKTDAVLADELGVSKQAFSSWRTGKRSPTRSMIEKIAETYNVDVAWLMGYDGEHISASMSIRLPIPNYHGTSKGTDAPTESLTPEESRLLTAFRGADERARQDAIITLEAHQTASEKKSV